MARDATYRVIRFPMRDGSVRFVALAWNYEEGVLLSTRDMDTYAQAMAALEATAGERAVRLRWFERIVERGISVCADCVEDIVYGDNSAPEEGEECFWVLDSEGDGDGHFSWRPCERCSDSFGGVRYLAAIIGPEDAAKTNP